MAVKLASHKNIAYNGLSTDDKPTAPAEGSIFNSVDTGESWVFLDDMWTYQVPADLARELAGD